MLIRMIILIGAYLMIEEILGALHSENMRILQPGIDMTDLTEKTTIGCMDSRMSVILTIEEGILRMRALVLGQYIVMLMAEQTAMVAMPAGLGKLYIFYPLPSG